MASLYKIPKKKHPDGSDSTQTHMLSPLSRLQSTKSDREVVAALLVILVLVWLLLETALLFLRLSFLSVSACFFFILVRLWGGVLSRPHCQDARWEHPQLPSRHSEVRKHSRPPHPPLLGIHTDTTLFADKHFFLPFFFQHVFSTPRKSNFREKVKTLLNIDSPSTPRLAAAQKAAVGSSNQSQPEKRSDSTSTVSNG